MKDPGSAAVRMRRLLIAAFCAFVLLSLSILGVVVFYLARQTLVHQAVQHLEAVATAQTSAVETVAKIWLDRLKLIASRTQLRISLREWQEAGAEQARALGADQQLQQEWTMQDRPGRWSGPSVSKQT